MNNKNFTLQLTKSSDFEAFLNLKSETENIYWSGFNSVPDRNILWSHFIESIYSKTRYFFLLFEGEQAIGYLYIDYIMLTRAIEIAYGISKTKSGSGLAKTMINLGLSYIELEYDTIIAWIAISNIASIKSVESLGFKRTGEEEYRTFLQEVEQIKFCKYIKKKGDTNEL
ncbi:GNAT family N-acetyltransferase [Aeromonas popoffii]|uniref:GNAT family N-acetyltransferase n=1 Tax=Aeromonas popoffii TaxID=70856 RepID=UPI0005A70385|nr:GNAT family protein [Aeromonas popoffii]